MPATKAGQKHENLMTSDEKRADAEMEMHVRNHQVLKDRDFFKRELLKLKYIEEAIALVTHKFTFQLDLSDGGVHESAVKQLLDGFSGKASLTHKSGQKNASGEIVSAGNCPTLWTQSKHTHRVSFLLNKPLDQHMTMKIKVVMLNTTDAWEKEARDLLDVNHKMEPNSSREDGKDDGYNTRWEIYFTASADEISENGGKGTFGFCATVSQMLMEE
jgi:hypothetical protein